MLRHRLRAGHLADRHGQALSRRVSTCATTGCCASRRARSAQRRTTRAHRGPRQPAARRAASATRCAALRRRHRADRAARRRRSTSTRSSPASRRRCSSARRSTTSACRRCCDALVDWAPPPQPRDGGDRASSQPDRADVHRLRVQDPGEHGPAAPRPHRVLARVLGPLRARHEGAGTCAPAREMKLANALTFMAQRARS